MGAYSKTSQRHSGAMLCYNAITEQADNLQLQQAVGMEADTFLTTYSMLSLHTWLLILRLANASNAKEAAAFQQVLYTHYFQPDIERRVYSAGVKVGFSGVQQRT